MFIARIDRFTRSAFFAALSCVLFLPRSLRFAFPPFLPFAFCFLLFALLPSSYTLELLEILGFR
jgi:hypothetical protein